MSNLVINDLAFLTELDAKETSIAGGAAAGASAAADPFSATAASGSTNYGKLKAEAYGGGFFFGPKSTVKVKDYYNPWY